MPYSLRPYLVDIPRVVPDRLTYKDNSNDSCRDICTELFIAIVPLVVLHVSVVHIYHDIINSVKRITSTL